MLERKEKIKNVSRLGYRDSGKRRIHLQWDEVHEEITDATAVNVWEFLNRFEHLLIFLAISIRLKQTM